MQPALLFSQKGLHQKLTTGSNSSQGNTSEEFTATSRINYLELPVVAAYSLGSQRKFQIFAGSYLAIAVSSSFQYTDTQQASGLDPRFYSKTSYTLEDSGAGSYRFGSQFPEPDPCSGGSSAAGTDKTRFLAQARRFDAGITAGAGYRLGPVQVQMSYDLGLLNVQPDYPSSYRTGSEKGYNRVLQLAATYFFTPRQRAVLP